MTNMTLQRKVCVGTETGGKQSQSKQTFEVPETIDKFRNVENFLRNFDKRFKTKCLESESWRINEKTFFGRKKNYRYPLFLEQFFAVVLFELLSLDIRIVSMKQFSLNPLYVQSIDFKCVKDDIYASHDLT
ncbi:hypothetical protein NPIL_166181 [Nephila pilipes]|uniref:Uncharacterized protein n=1 Tax=Nephila pilipes TaxID=299642 RepID=A0A8X6MTK3_NEPPI|nr:hypothetical protein NPIL_166181 [Nephila pilipes]